MNEVPILKYPPIDLPVVRDFSLQLIRDLNQSDDQILHFQGAPRLLSRLLLEKTVKQKVTVLTTHGFQESFTILNNNKAGFFIEPFFVNSFRQLDHIIALSKSDLKTLVHIGIHREKITVIPNGIDEEKFKKRKKFIHQNGKLKILTVARFDNNKNHSSLIQLIGQLSKHFDLEAYFVGAISDPKYYAGIVDLIKRSGLENTIKIGLSLSDPELVDCYLSCDLFVLASTVETSPLVLLEAMYAGLPVIATNVGGVSELMADSVNGYLVEPNDLATTYSKCFKLLENPKLRVEFRERNKRTAERYSWSKVAQDTANLYNGLLRSWVK